MLGILKLKIVEGHSPDRTPDREYAGVCDGRGDESSADRSDRRVVHRRSGTGERIPGPGGFNSGTICAEPVWKRVESGMYRTGDLARWRWEGTWSMWAGRISR